MSDARSGSYFILEGVASKMQAQEGRFHCEAACGPAETGFIKPPAKSIGMKDSKSNHPERVRGQGRKVKIKFYEVGFGSEKVFDYMDQEPVGDLLDRYCGAVKEARESHKFEVWEHEVLNADTLQSLKRDHGMEGNSIDVSSRS